jgi:hypothetical protein
MTPEELEQTLKEVSEQLSELSTHEDKLTKPEWKLQRRLIEEQEILQKIKKVRASGINSPKESYLLAQYRLFKEAGSRHPFLNYLIKLKLRSYIWG